LYLKALPVAKEVATEPNLTKLRGLPLLRSRPGGIHLGGS